MPLNFLSIIFSLTILLSPLYDLARWKYFGEYPTTVLEFLIWLFVGLVLVGKLRQGNFSWPRTRLDKPILLLLTASLIAVLVSPDHFAALGRWRAFFLEPILVFYLLVELLRSNRSFSQIVQKAILLGAGWLSLLGILQFFFGLAIVTPDQFNRAHAVYNNGNHLAHFIGPVILVLVNRKNWPALVLLVPAFIATRSLGGYLGLGAGLAAIFLQRFFRGEIFWAFVRRGVILASLAFILFLSQIYRFTPKVVNPWIRTGGTATVRLCLWEGSWELLKERPLWGAGLGAFKQLYQDKYHTCDAEPLSDADNMLLNFWTKTGVLGLVGVITLFYSIFWPPSSSFQLPFVYWFVHGLVDVPYFKNDISLLWWVFLALWVSSQSFSPQPLRSQPHPRQQF